MAGDDQVTVAIVMAYDLLSADRWQIVAWLHQKSAVDGGTTARQLALISHAPYFYIIHVY